VEIDSTFAMAFLYLAWTEGAFKLMSPLSDLSNERKLISLAQEYSDNVTIKEHNQIGVIQAIINRDFPLVQTLTAQSLENYPDEKSLWLYNGIANSLMGDMVRSIHAYEKVLEIDPAYANAYMCIAYDYSTMNEHEKAISTAKKYLALQPDVWNTYDTAWDIYMDAGMYDAAYSTCEEALRVNKDWWHNFELSKSLTDLIRGDGNKARDMIHRIKDRDPSKLNLFEHLGCFYMYEGRFKEAADEFSQYVKAALEVKSQRWEMKSRLSLGRFLTIEGRSQEAQAEFIKVKELSKKVYADSYNTDWIIADFYGGKSAILEGDLNKAEAFSEGIRGFIEENNYDPVLMDYHFMLRAEIDITKKNTADALKMLDHVSVLTRPDSPNCRILYARIDIQKEDLDKAIEEYQGLYDDITTMFSTEGGSLFTYLLERSRVHSNIARLYEEKGDLQQAILYYQRALDQWKNADEDLPELVDAKTRLARLEGGEK
jgi:tetratricopeptide (TPR) repeat protein